MAKFIHVTIKNEPRVYRINIDHITHYYKDRVNDEHTVIVLAGTTFIVEHTITEIDALIQGENNKQ